MVKCFSWSVNSIWRQSINEFFCEVVPLSECCPLLLRWAAALVAGSESEWVAKWDIAACAEEVHADFTSHFTCDLQKVPHCLLIITCLSLCLYPCLCVCVCVCSWACRSTVRLSCYTKADTYMKVKSSQKWNQSRWWFREPVRLIV